MPLNEGLSFIDYMFDRENDSLLWQRWVAGVQYEMSFDEFKQAVTRKPQRPDKEVIAEAQDILNAFYMQGGDKVGNI